MRYEFLKIPAPRFNLHVIAVAATIFVMVLLAVVEQVMDVLGGILCQELDPLSQKYHLIMRI